jgi:hypothetical protein
MSWSLTWLPPLSGRQTSQVRGLYRLNDSKNIEMKVDRASVCSKQCGESVQIVLSIIREITDDREDQSTVDKRYNSKMIQ